MKKVKKGKKSRNYLNAEKPTLLNNFCYYYSIILLLYYFATTNLTIIFELILLVYNQAKILKLYYKKTL